MFRRDFSLWTRRGACRSAGQTVGGSCPVALAAWLVTPPSPHLLPHPEGYEMLSVTSQSLPVRLRPSLITILLHDITCQRRQLGLRARFLLSALRSKVCCSARSPSFIHLLIYIYILFCCLLTKKKTNKKQQTLEVSKICVCVCVCVFTIFYFSY